MRKSAKFCPVPSEQQPINEYEQLKDSWFFRWVTLANVEYYKKLAWVWVWGWLIAGPIAAASFVPRSQPLLFGLGGAIGAEILVILAVLRLYLGWTYISDRLNQEKVFYEESGWYDGQTWQKPPEVLTRDRLIVTYQIQPMLNRLRQTIIVLTVAMVSGGILLLWQSKNSY